MNEDQFSSERTELVSFRSMEISKLRLLTHKVLSVDSFMVTNMDSQHPGNDENLVHYRNHLVCQQELFSL